MKMSKTEKRDKLSLIITLGHWQNKAQLCNRPFKFTFICLNDYYSYKSCFVIKNFNDLVILCMRHLAAAQYLLKKGFFVFFFHFVQDDSGILNYPAFPKLVGYILNNSVMLMRIAVSIFYCSTRGNNKGIQL